jgi:hypothetical protein
MAKKCKKNGCGSGKCQATTECESSTTANASFVPPPLSAFTAPEPAPEYAVIQNPAAAIKTHSTTFEQLYDQYNGLRTLARPLNGLQHTDNFPANVTIHNVQIKYSVDGFDGEANISSVKSVGELAPLIGTALRELVDKIGQELLMLDRVTAAMKTAVEAARPGSRSMPTPITLQQRK